MRAFLRIIGYILIVLFGIDLIYIIISGFAPGGRSFADVLWHSFWAAGLVFLGVWLVGKFRIVKKTDAKHGVLGISSLILGVIGVFWWGSVLGIIAVLLAILQFRRHTSKTAIAGLCLGVIDFILAAIWHDFGLMPSIF